MDASAQSESNPAGGRHSVSVTKALLWAEASAALRGQSYPVTEPDLFLGTLLAHPDTNGEMRRLLSHFGLTGRDLLPDDFPAVTVDRLRTAAALVGVTESPPSLDHRVRDVVSRAEELAHGGPTQLVHLLGAQLQGSQFFQQKLDRQLQRAGFSTTKLASEYGHFLSSALDLGSDTVAGEQLNDWLTKSFPRTPAYFPPFSNDKIDPKSDFIGVDLEADAFAYLISSQALVPPLAIGLFGNWGSGKSFLMKKIKYRIGQLTDLASVRQTDSVWSNIAHIEFNAWEYAETNLWAALLHKIFDELSPEARATLSERRSEEVKKVKDQIDEKASILQELEMKVPALLEAETKGLAALEEAQKEFLRAKQETARIRKRLVAADLESNARVELPRELLVASESILGKPLAEDLTTAMDQLRIVSKEAATNPWLQAKYWTAKRITFTVVTMAIPLICYFALEGKLGPSLAFIVGGLSAGLGFLMPSLRAAASFATDRRREVAEAESRVDESLNKALAPAREVVEAADEGLKEAQQRRLKVERAADQAREEQSELEKKRDFLTVGTVLTAFLVAREASDEYRRHLSVVSRVKEDLQDLSDLTREYNGSHPQTHDGPPNRIVLYIDDLDRCPPNRVVEVLEAVHLLLSFELFVVVVAVDTRWLTSALHASLPALEKDDGASPPGPKASDYLEKIFQIPFQIEALNDDARRRLLRGLLLPSVAPANASVAQGEGTSLRVGTREQELVDSMLTTYGVGLDIDAKPLSVTPTELAFIESLAPLIGGTPRRVKRFINICQLLLAMKPPLSSAGDQPTERISMCLMAALHEGVPLLADRMEQLSKEGRASTLRAALDALEPTELFPEKGRLEAWLGQHGTGLPGSALESAPMGRLLLRYPLIRRLRFEVNAEKT